MCVCIESCQSDGMIDDAEWRFLLTGKAISSANDANPAPEWIDARMWSEITQLTTLYAFKPLGRCASIVVVVVSEYVIQQHSSPPTPLQHTGLTLQSAPLTIHHQ